jgi:hypothetical protein
MMAEQSKSNLSFDHAQLVSMSQFIKKQYKDKGNDAKANSLK